MEGFSLRRSQLWAVAALAFGLLLAACSGQEAKPPRAPLDLAPPDQQVLRLRLGGEPKSIDPALTNFDFEISVGKVLFSGLFTYDESLKPVVGIADEMPSVDNGGISKDGKVYTIKIRKDAKWSDGKALTAKDVVYSFKRMLDPKLAGPYTSFYFGIEGAEEYNTALGTKAAPKTPTDAELAMLRDAVKVTAKDDYTVVLNLKQPVGSFLQVLAIWPAFPVRQDIVEKYGDKWTEAGNLIGNGPFILKEWAHNDHFTFEANPNWHGPKPKLTRLIYRIMDDDTAAYAAYLNNELDMVGVPPANRREVASPASPLNKELVRKPQLSTSALLINNKEKPFDNVKVRQAFATAIDRQAFVEGVLQGVGQPATTWIAPGEPGYDGELGKQYALNATEAKQLLTEAGYPDGKGLAKVTMLFVARDTDRLIAQFLQDQFKKNLGVDIDLEFVDSKARQTRFNNGQYQLAYGGWGADWPWPDNWLPEFFGTGGSNNQLQYSNPEFDKLAKQAAAEPDQKKQLELYDKAQKIALDDAALAPIYFKETFVLVKAKVKDLILTGLDGNVRGDYYFWRTYIAQ